MVTRGENVSYFSCTWFGDIGTNIAGSAGPFANVLSTSLTYEMQETDSNEKTPQMKIHGYFISARTIHKQDGKGLTGENVASTLVFAHHFFPFTRLTTWTSL